MSIEEKKSEVNLAEELAGLSPEQMKEEIIKKLEAKASEKGNALTYADMSEYLDSLDLDKTVMDDIYDTLMARDINIDGETEPEDFTLILDGDDDVDVDSYLSFDNFFICGIYQFIILHEPRGIVGQRVDHTAGQCV